GLEPRDWNAHFLECGAEARAAAEARQRRFLASQLKGTRPTHELVAYTGTFEEPAYGSAEIVLEKDRLVLKWRSFNNPLEHFHFDTFTVDNDDLSRPQLVFTLADGHVTGFQFNDVEFKRAKGKK